MRAVPALAAGAIALAVGLTGCKACREDAKPAAQESPSRSAEIGSGSARVRPPSRPPPVRPRVPPGAKGVGTSITLEETTPILPTIPNTTVVDAPTAGPKGSQVHLGWCVAAADQRQALAAISTGLQGGGWTNLHSRGVGARVAVAAEQGPFRLNVTLSTVPHPDCSQAQGKFFASVAVFKIASLEHPPALDGAGSGGAGSGS